MRSSIATLSLAAAAVTAVAETQIPIWVPGLSEASDPGEEPAVSIIKVESSTTVMALGCATTPSDGCVWDQFTSYTIASSSIYAADVVFDDITVNFACTSAKAFQCVLDEPASLIDESSTGSLKVTTTIDQEELYWATGTVTAGEGKLAATGAAQSSGAAKSTASGSTLATSASAGATPSASGAEATGSAASASGSVAPAETTGPAASASGSGAPAETTGAAGKFGVEGAAWAVLAGAAAMQML